MRIQLWDDITELRIGRDEQPKPKAAKAKGRRHYAAARVNRLNPDWTTATGSANRSLYPDLRILRARARQMAKDAPHFRKFMQMVRSNVIGPKGLQLMPRARKANGDLNTKLNKRVGEVWWEWGHAENCSVTGKLNWVAAQRLFVTHLARDGEVLVQHVKADNPFGYALKFWNVDWLDETYNDTLPNGNRVIMSVELDTLDRAVAFYLTTPVAEIMFTRSRERKRTRVDASEFIHAFLVLDDESQVRAATWFAAVLLEGKNLEDYKDGVINVARMGVHQIGFLETNVDDPNDVEYTGEDDEGFDEPLNIDVSPLAMNTLPAGYSLKQFDPKHPTQNHTEFKNTILADVASGLGVAYFSLAGDMAAVNFSSARVGQGEERDFWRELQDFVGQMFCRPVYHRWVESAFLNGKLKVSPRDYLEIQDPMWRPRGWQYLNPQQETAAHVVQLENKLTTLTDVLGERGVDIQEHFETLQQEQAMAAEYGLELKYGSALDAGDEGEEADGRDPESDEPPKPDDESERGYTNGRYAN